MSTPFPTRSEPIGTVLVNVWSGPGDEAPIWSGYLAAPPAVADLVWITIEQGDLVRGRARFRVIRRDWAFYSSSAAVELYVERDL